jgi:phosphoribosylaminoimidazole-succinocarboxamide synthase
MTTAITDTATSARQPDFRGKVRDVYDLGDTLLLVATDRISAFDWVNPVGIPDKGRVLTQIARFWFATMADLAPNHLISCEIADFPPEFQQRSDVFQHRSMLVRKCAMFPVEFVIRGYLAGSGLKEYREQGTVCGHHLPPGLVEGSPLPEPLYTPATKAAEGHDINITPAQAGEIIGTEYNDRAQALAKAVYNRAHDQARERGLILCDTKFEFGLLDGELVLADEILTPDSSRYWPADQYRPGHSQPSFDKQYVRDYLESTGWDKQSPQPPLPPHIVEGTRQKYLEAYRQLTGKEDLEL